jgi:hypothetical protein
MGHRLFLETNERKSPMHRGKQNRPKPLVKVSNMEYLK